MATKSTRTTWTPSQIKDHTQKIEKAVAQHKRAKKFEHFTAITPEQIKQKFKRVNSPMIVSQGWNSTTPGGIVNYSLGIYNPDPTLVIWLFAHVWIGSGNVDPDPGTFLLNVDRRFPSLTEPPFMGLQLAPGASAILDFSLHVPATVQQTNYMGNSCLMQVNWHDVGTYLDRGTFVFAVA